MNGSVDVTFIVSGTFVNIHVDSVFVARMAIDSENGNVVFHTANEDFIDLLAELVPIASHKVPINVFVTKEEIDEDMALPRWSRVKVSPQSDVPTQTVHRPGGESIRQSEVDPILEEIVSSYIHEPNQTKARTSKISHEISKKLDVPVMSIAGVRAALNRGVYTQTLEQMIAARKKQISTMAQKERKA